MSTPTCAHTCESVYFHEHHGEGHVLDTHLVCGEEPDHEGKHAARCVCDARLVWTDRQVRKLRRRRNFERFGPLGLVAFLTGPSLLLWLVSDNMLHPDLLYTVAIGAPAVAMALLASRRTLMRVLLSSAATMAVASVWSALLGTAWHLIGILSAVTYLYFGLGERKKAQREVLAQRPEQIP
jgi:hypothetical protein